MKLSIGLMVKNEEKNLDRCLEAIVPILNEIEAELIVVDTGSEDSTIEIAKKYTQRVYTHLWQDDFAQMRNTVVNYAKGEWFLFLDADEVVVDFQPLLDFIKSDESKKYNGGTIIIKNILDKNNPDSFNMFHATRLARKTKDFHFKGKIHEQPQIKPPVKHINLFVDHYGYDNTDNELMEYKYQRTGKLLRDSLEEEPNNIYLWYQLSKTYLMHKDHAEALEAAEKSYELFKKHNEKGRKYYTYALVNLVNLYLYFNNLYRAVEIAQEGLSYKNYVIDLWFYLGKAKCLQNKYEEGLKAYDKYIDIVVNQEKKAVKDITIVNSTVNRLEEAYHDCAFACFKLKQYENSISYTDKIKREYKNYNKIINIKIKSCLFLSKLDILTKFLSDMVNDDKAQLSYSVDLIEYIIDSLIQEKKNSDDSKTTFIKNTDDIPFDIDYFLLIKSLANLDHAYGWLNKLRLSLHKSNHSGEITIDSVDIKNEAPLRIKELVPELWRDIIKYYLFEINDFRELTTLLSEQKDKDILKAFEKLNEISDLSQIRNYVENLKSSSGFNEIRILKKLALLLLIQQYNPKKSNELDNELVQIYLSSAVKYSEKKYSKKAIDNFPNVSINESEDLFIALFKKAWLLKQENKILEYIRTLRQALQACPEMNFIVEFLISQEQMNDNNPEKEIQKTEEFEQMKKKFLLNVNQLIESGLIEQAKSLIAEFDKIIGDDIEVLSAKAILYMIEGHFEKSEDTLKYALKIDEKNTDVLFNLGYLKEQQSDYNSAYYYYSRTFDNSNEKEFKVELKNKLSEIEKIIKNSISLNSKESMMPPKITIRTKVYNSVDFIRECAESVINQTFNEFEWIIIDNASDDGTLEILKEYEKKDNRIKLFRNEKNTVINKCSDSQAFLTYLSNLKSDYICYLDGDDYLDKNCLLYLYQHAKENDLDIVVGGAELFVHDTSKNMIRIPPFLNSDSIEILGNVWHEIYGCLRPAWGKLIRSDIHNQVFSKEIKKYYSYKNGLDTILVLETMKKSTKIGAIKAIIYNYRIHSASIYSTDTRVDRYQDYLVIYTLTKSLLNSWDKLTDKNVVFMAEVLYHSLLDCIKSAEQTIQKPLSERIGLINAILGDKEILGIINESQLYPDLLKNATSAINKILSEK